MFRDLQEGFRTNILSPATITLHTFPAFLAGYQFSSLAAGNMFPCASCRFPCNSLIPLFCRACHRLRDFPPLAQGTCFLQLSLITGLREFSTKPVFFLFSLLLGSWSFFLYNDWLQFAIEAYSNFSGYRDWPPGPLRVRRADLYSGR